MTQEQKRPRLDPEPSLGPTFPKLTHPDLDLMQTEEVEEPPNKDDVKPEVPHPEPPE
ncbi:hypothetical protein [Amycolatopsis taiwanensis]|uniref:Uncharacterized protein n=1 Tax=Amycolatopsis taiwanensis TaxID=342230 RepID=A0A9W6R5F3_9PSEU|nr:hypothetical protein [Amycolatopsis taiwanensis]GLY69434.1 hypothetical protein Atai01_60530 [Amycolatopsis taiwanensis]